MDDGGGNASVGTKSLIACRRFGCYSIETAIHESNHVFRGDHSLPLNRTLLKEEVKLSTMASLRAILLQLIVPNLFLWFKVYAKQLNDSWGIKFSTGNVT